MLNKFQLLKRSSFWWWNVKEYKYIQVICLFGCSFTFSRINIRLYQFRINFLVFWIINYFLCINSEIFNFFYLIYRYLCLLENQDPQFLLEYRVAINMKGKNEPMNVWFLSRENQSSSVIKSSNIKWIISNK